MNNLSLPRIWFSTKTRVDDPWRILNYDDVGAINVSETIIDFHGKKYSFIIEKKLVTSIKEIRRTFPWKLHLSVILMVLSIFGILPSILIFLSDNNIFRSFFLSIILCGFSLFLLVLMSFNLYLLERKKKWIQIQYRDSKNISNNVCFADGKLFWGLFGNNGDKELLDAIRK